MKSFEVLYSPLLFAHLLPPDLALGSFAHPRPLAPLGAVIVPSVWRWGARRPIQITHRHFTNELVAVIGGQSLRVSR